MSELLMPPYPNGSVQQQLTQQYSYLFQMAQQLNMALSALEGGAVSTAGNSGQQRKSGGATAAAGKAALENAEQFQNLRAMIVKTAKQVSRNMEQLETRLSNPEFCVKTYDFTAYVPDSMRPSATLTVALVNDNALLEQWGLWVRGMSCLQYAVEASAVGGATLKSCRFTFAGQTVSGFSGVTAPIGMAGTLTPAAVVTDSRGRTTTVSAAPVAVFDYQTPSLRTSVAYRCNAAGVEDSGGACLQVKAAGSCWPLDGRNTVTLRARYRPVGGVYGGYTTLVSGLTAQIADSLDKDTTYEVELSAVDTVGSVRAVSYTSSNASVAFHLRSGGVGAAFGKLADSAALQCAWDASFDGDMTVLVSWQRAASP